MDTAIVVFISELDGQEIPLTTPIDKWLDISEAVKKLRQMYPWLYAAKIGATLRAPCFSVRPM